MLINGRNIIIYEDGVAVAASKSCEINVDVDVIEIASPTNGEWNEYIVGRKKWSVKLDFLVVNTMERLLHVGNKVRMTMGVTDINGVLGADRLTGYAICKTAVVTGTVGNLAKGSWNFVGCGSLERIMVNLRDSQQRDLHDSNGNQLRALEELTNLV